MTIFNGTAANNTFPGTTADDVFNYGNVTYSGATVIGARGQDTISSGGGFDRLVFANLSIDHIAADRVGNNFVLQIQPTVDWDESNPVSNLGGVTITNFFAADGNGVIDRFDFQDAYVLTSYLGGVFRAKVFTPAGVLVENNVDGSDGNDSLTGTGVADYMTGGLGNDTLVGLAGNDELEGDAGNDRLDAGNGDDTLWGGAGNDTLVAGAGFDTLHGDAGTDTADYAFANGSIEVNLALSSAKNGSASSGNSTNVGFDVLNGIERVVGGNFADLLIGNDAANTLSGGRGNDQIVGGGGNDNLLGGAGSDYFDGSASGSATSGRGNDTIDGGVVTDLINYLDGNTVAYWSSGAGVTVNLQTGTAGDGFGGTDKLLNINFVNGSNRNDTLTGSTKLWFESFNGGTGNDVINGGTITDTLALRNSNRAAFNTVAVGVNVDLQAGTATGQGSDTLVNINQVRGSGEDDTLRGSNGTVITEVLEGMNGNDVIDGRGGLDMARYDYAGNAVNVSLASGIATVSTVDHDTLANIEGIRGSHYNDTLTGGNAANATLEFFRGNGGSDLINGGAGYDRVEYNNSMQGVNVKLGGAAAGTAKDGMPILNGAIQAPGAAGAVIGTDTLRNIEAVRGSDFNDTLAGSAIATQETFEGRGGNDLINGGAGLDRASYFQSASGVTVTLGLAGAQGTAADGWGGTDRLIGIENVEGSRDSADRITGNELANVLDGLGGNDMLAGGAGNDSLVGGAGNDLLVGGAGKDSLNGGAGLDLFRFNAALSATTNVDRITGFAAADDTIQLDDAVFAGIGAPGALAAGAFRAGAAAGDAGDRIVYNSATGELFFDADGSGAGAKLLFATVAAGTVITYDDIWIS
jgi:Ca2+-binding RTX toxin-like protein